MAGFRDLANASFDDRSVELIRRDNLGREFIACLIPIGR